MFCETVEELDLYAILRNQFCNSHDYTLDLMAWVFLNKPDKFKKIIDEHMEANVDGANSELIEMQSIDIQSLLQKK
jgi:hypothetical protein